MARHLPAVSGMSIRLERSSYDSSTECDTFSACTNGVRDVLDVGTDNKLTRLGENASSYAELGVGA